MKQLHYGDCCLIVTGCMFPQSGVKNLVISNYEIRKQQYMESLQYYIDDTEIKNICYCDNSLAACNEGLIKLANDKGKHLEWISFRGDTEKTVKKGKGYGEGEIIDYAIQNSRLVAEADVLIKVTGRLRVLNMWALLRMAAREYSYFEMHCGYVDSRCYVVKKEDYVKYLSGVKENVEDDIGYYIEHALFDKINSHSDRFHPLPFALNISGMSGSMGIAYNERKMKYTLKSIKRFFMAVRWHMYYKISSRGRIKKGQL